MIREQHDRFKGLDWYKHLSNNKFSICVGGAGGIGSYLIFALTRAGYLGFVYDDDIYENHNLGGQFANKEDIGKPKVLALKENTLKFSDSFFTPMNKKLTSASVIDTVCISAFDNTEARKILFEKWLKFYDRKEEFVSSIPLFYMDGRLTAENLEIYCVYNDETVEKYKESLNKLSEGVIETPCTIKSTSHSAMIIAGLMTGLLNNYISNKYSELGYREIPYYTSFNLELMLYNNEI